jgi:nucleoside-diphosphate-sugar epimerase
MKFVVTGGAGFIGSNLVDELVSRDHEVVVIDDLSTGNTRNLDQSIDKIKLIEGSILDIDLLKREFLGADFVIHLAAIPSVPRSIDDPVATNAVNISGTLNVLMAARETDIKRVVYSASSSRYGNTTESVKNEDLPTNPLSPYALQKFTAEEYCRLFYDLYGLETVACVFFNVFGPRQDPNSPYSAVIPKFASAMMTGDQPVIYGDGETSRDFTYVSNNVEAVISACTAKGICGQSINIACGKSETLNGLVKLIGQNIDSDVKPIYEDFRAGDVKHSLASIKKAKNLLGYEPKVSVEEGITNYINWYKKNNGKV